VIRSSASTLHAKTFTVDRTRMFIGSFNFDPRSMHLNTELGFVVENPAMASRLQDSFDDLVPQRAYEVILNDDGDLVWIERNDDREVRHETEPGTTFLQRASISVLARLPIAWLL
jgi:putative cardiolipin synthase